ncbi:hypothetical protein LAUMK42_03931 [Mycobacterium persicum]|uniref:Uncharacterized protein n=1 Tax=Mycobacterium persicum TaxID=1487726 RepID=A0AB38UXE7_9MYCO|nr:hypothetical protein LAUMK42_03931 [Mycobacterium persicum]
MRRLAIGHHRAELCYGVNQVPPHQQCPSETEATLTRAEPVADGVGDITSLFGGRAGCHRVTLHDSRIRLLGKDLAQPPPVADCAGQVSRLGVVRCGRVGVVEVARDDAARRQDPRQQSRIGEFTSEDQGVLCPSHAVAAK